MREPYRVGLVACGATKLPYRAAARDLYRGGLFQKSAALAERTCAQWFILSAKHGLVAPDTMLEPYEQQLARRNGEWADRVREQLIQELGDRAGVVLVAYAGRAYREVLRPCPWPFEIPMQGLGIGEQLHYLKTQLEATTTTKENLSC